MTPTALVLTSHGFFAFEALKSVEMITGKPVENAGVVSVTEGKDYQQCLEELLGLVEKLDTENGVLVFCDIYGGTPANIATALALSQKEVQVFSGLNLVMLLEVVTSREQSTLSQLRETVQSCMGSVVVDISEKLKEMDENADQVDAY
jgi:PTS system mannose-specific IIA component